MKRRIKLHERLKQFTDNVYFQPPESFKIKYPAIVYSLSRIGNTHADDRVYNQSLSFEVTVIDSNPESTIVTDISNMPMCRFDRQFTANNLYHTIFTITV